ncbi:MAG TPA: ABC transporter substrate-binding protein [Crenotrichaceae bacterium]|nr:ABC transporter substrate-binding protein [Crenotrichaceae bacterium]
MKRSFFANNWILLFIIFPFSSQAFADQELLPPQQVIQTVSSELKTRIGDKAYKGNMTETMRIVEEVLSPHVDQHRVSALALGKYWKKATPEQRAAFEEEYKRTMIRLYSSAYASYKDWSIRFMPMKLKPDAKKTIVKIEVDRSGGQPVAISYRMVNKSGNWKVYDIIIEGISLVSNYRSQFTEIIDQNKGSVQALIDHLAQKNQRALDRINSSA